MHTEFHLKPHELDINFLEGIKRMFSGKNISITIAEEMDETEYLLSTEANRKMLLESIQQVKEGKTVKVNFNKSSGK